MEFEVPPLIILGPTASGKTHLAVQVAAALDGEIISADSRQVYREMNIGTGKDLDEYQVGSQKIPYHLIDMLEPGSAYNVNDFHSDFERAYTEIVGRNRVPVLCGGTGFYIYSLLKGHAYQQIPVNEPLREQLQLLSDKMLLKRFQNYDTAYRNLADTSTRKRLIRAVEISEYLQANPGTKLATRPTNRNAVIFGLNPDTEMRRERISRRLAYRLQNGMVEEVETLLQKLSPAQLIYYGLEYKYITLYLTGDLDFNTMKTRLETEIHRFAKRQMTFFRKMEKDGFHIHWLSNASSEVEKVSEILELYRAGGL